MYDDNEIVEDLDDVTAEEAEQEIEIPANDFIFAARTPRMDADVARAKVIATFVASPGASFTREEFTAARMDRYGQTRAWGLELLEELEEGGLIKSIGMDTWQVTDYTAVIERWA